jgi:starch-binding outer membrane protein SusE/F
MDMKIIKIVKCLSLLVMTVAFMSSCKDDAVKPTLNSTIAANEFLAPSVSAYVLTIDNASNPMETFKWTVPKFGFNASVTYKLQIDKATGDFANALELASVNSGKTEAAIKVSDVNEKLLGLGFNPEEPASVKLRVVSTVSDKVNAVISNVRSITVTPYATSFPPIYGMGAALNGWGPWPSAAVELQSSSFKKYETIAKFTNGGAFRFFAQTDYNPVSYNYPFFTSVDALFINANDGDSNLKFVGTTGYYKVSVDLKAKTVTMLAVAEPVLYMMGQALNGWGPWPSAGVKMTYISPGVFETNANFTNSGAASTFRFFAQADWSPDSYNYPYFTTVDSKFENANDGDKNLRFIGSSGPFKIRVDLNKKTVVVGDLPKPKLYMMGAALNGWGPWPTAAVEMTYISAGVYEATTTFKSGETFRFFAQADWSPTSYNYPYFTTVDAKFVNANDGDSNLKFVPATGSVIINVNLTTKVVSVK